MVSNKDSMSGDALALVEAIIGRKIDRSAMASALNGSDSDFDHLVDMKFRSELERETRPDEQPKDLRVGCINPYALVQAMIGREVDQCSVNASRILADVLATDYDELFDMKHNSVLYAGLKLNENQRTAEELSEKDIKIMRERDLETPDLSRAQRVEDLEKLGMKDLMQARIKMVRFQNGKLRMVLQARDMGNTVSNTSVTQSIFDLTLPYRNKKDQWNPPNTSWRDVSARMFQSLSRRMMMGMEMLGMGNRMSMAQQLMATHNIGAHEVNCARYHQFDDPVQGAVGNSWLVAALFSCYWADPSMINRAIQPCREERQNNGGRGRDDRENNRQQTLAIKFHDKGGRNNAQTATVEVDYDIPVNNSDGQPIYCHSSSGCALWPSLYEKAFAKWVTGTQSDHPDLTQTSSGDPIKAMAQINNRTPEYYFTERRSGQDLIGLVRTHCVNFKTINPMCAYTHATGDRNTYRGANLVANHAYSVLGWAEVGQRQHIVIRNPWGVTEHPGLTSYPGVIDRVEADFWSPAALLDRGGVLAVEAEAFKELFACVGVAK